MKRTYRKRSSFDAKSIGLGFFALFVVYVAFKILTPPSAEVARVEAPDGSRAARLRKFYYVSQPSYKIDSREAGKLVWMNLLNLHTNVPHQTAAERIEWSPGSDRLYFKINGTSIWEHAFTE